jgi:hypothetical protein
MAGQTDILALVKQSAAKRIIFLPHAVRQMSKPDRMISTGDIRAVIESGEIVEDYPNDARGQSFLILGFVANRPLHVVCSPKDDYLAIITAYLPSAREWEENYRKRKIR